MDNALSTMPAMSIEQAIERYNAVLEFTKRVMKPVKDYGVIPGTDKPTLLKPGAEKLCSLFGLSPEFILQDEVKDFEKGLFYFRYVCRLTHNGALVATGEGSANSKEKKYRWRNVYANQATEEDKRVGRLETKKGKGGSTYQVYVVENTEPFDLINTLQKMAQKRALTAATLIAANASEFYTQDVEDMQYIDGEIVEEQQKATNQPATTKPAQPATSKPADYSKVMDSKNELYSSKTAEQLTAIIEKNAAPAEKIAAAKFYLKQKEGK